MKTLSTCMVVALMVVALIGCTTPADDKNQIGVILPLTGDYAYLGAEIQRGIDLRNAEEREPISVIYEDEQNQDLKLVVTAANKLIVSDKADVLMVLGAQEVAVLNTTVHENHVPLLTLWDNNKIISDAGPYVFSNGFSTELSAERIGDYAFTSLRLRRIAILRHDDVWAQLSSASFQKRFKELGGEIIFDESVPMDTADFKTPLLKIKQQNPDGIYAPLFPPNSIQFFTQSRDLKMSATILSGDLLIPDVVDGSDGAAEGAYSTNIYPENMQDLLIKYNAKYNRVPDDLAAVSLGYEGLDIVLAAVATEIPPRDALENRLGPTRSAHRVERIFQVQNGTFVAVG